LPQKTSMFINANMETIQINIGKLKVILQLLVN